MVTVYQGAACDSLAKLDVRNYRQEHTLLVE
jgi:hypothetical protein